MKTCTCCKNTKQVELFKPSSKYKDGFSSWCRDCHNEVTKSWHARNKKRKSEYYLKWQRANVSLCRANSDRWNKAHPHMKAAREARRRASKLLAMPKWLSEEDHLRIKLFYTAAAFLSKKLKYLITVDHIVPLQGKEVKGLHVPWNLQLLTSIDNSAKGAKL